MNFKKGHQLISYQKLTQSEEGKKLWNKYIEQVKEISRQYPKFFFKNTAARMIPNDARRHSLYATLDEDGIIIAFCVVALYTNIAEYLWLATEKNERGKGNMSELLEYIYEEIKEEDGIEQILIMVNASKSNHEKGDGKDEVQIDGKSRDEKKTLTSFLKKMDFHVIRKVHYYWYPGSSSHADVYAKFLNENKNSNMYYTEIDDYEKEIDDYEKGIDDYEKIKIDKVTGDTNKGPNEKTLTKIGWEIRELILKLKVQFINELLNVDKVKVIIGVAFFFNDKVIFFSDFYDAKNKIDTSEEPLTPHEWEVKDSTFSRSLKTFFEKCDTTHGFILHKKEWEKKDVHKVSDVFKRDEYTIFCGKLSEDGENKSLFYVLTPKVEKLFRHMNFWREITRSVPSTLIPALYHQLELSQRKLLKQEEKDYLENLIKCLGVSKTKKESPLSFYVLMSNFLLMKRKEEAHKALLSSFGHTFKSHIASLDGNFQRTCKNHIASLGGNLDNLKKEMAPLNTEVQFLKSLFSVLEILPYENISDLPEKYAKDYFIKEKPHNILNIAQKIRDWGSFMLYEGGKKKPRELSIAGIEDANIKFPMEINANNYRFSDAFYGYLLCELLRNTLKHGGKTEDSEKYEVPIYLKKYKIENKDCLIIENKTKKNMHNIGAEWTLWPRYEPNIADSPAILIEPMRRWKTGELWRRFNEEEKTFEVAIWLEGLYFEKEGNEN